MAQNCGKQIAQLETLTTQYSSLHTEVEKNDFINKHRKEIEGVVGATDNLRGAWDKIVKKQGQNCRRSHRDCDCAWIYGRHRKHCYRVHQKTPADAKRIRSLQKMAKQ